MAGTFRQTFFRLRTVRAGALALALGAAGLPAAPGQEAPAHRPRVGLVLSGGGARGMAHIGVLKALEEMRVRVDCIAGTSMGALVGALYASGMPVAEIERRFLSADWNDLFNDEPSHRDLSFRRKLDDLKNLARFELGVRGRRVVPPQGIVVGQKLGFMLRALTLPVAQVRDFDRLPIPFRAVATDMADGSMVVLGSGDLVQAVRASVSVPGVLSPVEIDGRLLADGGMVRNLPVDVVRGMGADVVIAVDTVTGLNPKARLHSAVAVSRQFLGIVMRRNVEEQLRTLTPADVLVTPDLSRITSRSMARAGESIACGYAAARGQEASLARYRAGDPDFGRWNHARTAGNSRLPGRIDFVRVTGTTQLSGACLLRQMHLKPGDPFDLETVERDLTRIYELGDFEQVDFRLERDGPRLGLAVEARDRSWGPHYLRAGLESADDFRSTREVNLLGSWRWARLNALGAEWQTDVRLGTTRMMRSEWYQPLNEGGMLFITPFVQAADTLRNRFDGDRETAQWRERKLEAGFQTGIQFEQAARLYTGLARSAADTLPVVGESDLSDISYSQAAVLAGAEIDRLDNLHFPRSGLRAGVDYYGARTGLGSDRSYDKVSGHWLQAFSLDENTLALSADAGSSLGTGLPGYDLFYLGGFLQLSGYQIRQLSGDRVALGRALVYRRIARLPPVIGDGVYVGVSAEAGNVWQQSFDLNALRGAGSLFVGADTLIGPLYLAYGHAGSSHDSLYLYLGRVF